MRLNWLLIVGLAIFGLIRHLLDALNMIDMSGGLSSALVTVAISAIWVSTVVRQQESNPFRTLFAVGVVHGLLVALLAVLTPIIPTGPEGFVPLFGVVGILAFNVVWGAIVGLIAQAIQIFRGQETST